MKTSVRSLGAFLSLVLVSASGAESPPQWAVVPPSGVTLPGLPAVTGHIHVDQFGYMPGMTKVAVLSDPRRGYNAGDHFSPGPQLEVRSAATGAVAFSAAPILFDEGRVDPASGDRGWWFDFTAVNQPGSYYIFDPKLGLRSPVFRIAPDVYAGVLRAATRMFYLQRQATDHRGPTVEGPWQDGPAFLQDGQARAIGAKDDPATARDLRGGWNDAGDTNKYPTFLGEVIHPLLYAWRANPAAFTDDFNLPESGNGLPDLLDEVKWELDWLEKMQAADGGVFIKMGMTAYSATWPESQDTHPRFYGPECSASTITVAGIFAHAAQVYGNFAPWKDFAAELRTRAERAWQWYRTHPRSYDCDSGEIRSGNGNLDAAGQDRAEAVAALQLWMLTGQDTYHEAFKAKVGTLPQLAEKIWSPRGMGQAEMLFDYLLRPGADPVICARITDAYKRAVASPQFMPPEGKNELYRAWMPESSYHWGSSQTRACHGLAALEGANAGLGGARTARLRERAGDQLHAFHGLNPLAFVYLSNMGRYGAEASATRMYHEAYNGPLPPGYVVGGPNRSYEGSLEWIRQQPPGKAYAELSGSGPANAWEITEPAIYYQACYIRLLAGVMAAPGSP